MKKVLALVLALLFVLPLLTACSTDEDDKGAIIPSYISKEVKSFDPVPMIYEAETVKYSGIFFEGLTYIDDNGKLQKGVAKKWYTKINEERGEYFLFFKLNSTTGWDDQRTVQADDFVYAWRRVLSPATNSPAACLLYNIKNAKEFKAGEVTADDLGVYAESDTLLKIEFNGPFDLDAFLETAASPALVPAREDLVSGNEGTWAMSQDNFAADGAFTIKGFEPGKTINLQRNAGYRRDPESDTSEMKVVKPYKFTIDYTMDADEQLEAFKSGDLYYIGNFSLEGFDSVKKKTKKQDLLSAYSYMFNCNVEPFDNALVRQALSVALDREEIADLASMASKPATGLVTYGVKNGTSGSFRKKGGKLIDTSADVAGAEKLLDEAGIKPSDYSFSILIGKDEADVAVAEYVKGVWEELGFKVSVSSKGGMLYQNALYGGDFDVVGLDYQGLTTDAFSFLAPFAREYSGSVIEIGEDTDTTAPHISGFDDKEYNELIDKIFNTAYGKERTSLLHNAEEMLIEKAPIIPLTFNVDNYMTKKISGVKSTIFGGKILTKVKLPGYKKINAKLLAAEEEE